MRFFMLRIGLYKHTVPHFSWRGQPTQFFCMIIMTPALLNANVRTRTLRKYVILAYLGW